jgi:hypothetical protein
VRGLLLFIAIASSAGCLRSTNFQCASDTECGAGGQCESDKFCSFADSACSGGRRYGDNSGPNSGECVGGGGPDMTGGEMQGQEMMGGEPPPMGCGANFVTLANSGPRGHKYLVINTTGTWVTQRDGCAAMNSWLAFPDGATIADARLELAAVNTAVGGDGAGWMGINDIVVELQYKNSLNAAVSTITAMLINTGGGAGGKDCLASNATAMPDEDCGTARKAVCECIP